MKSKGKRRFKRIFLVLLVIIALWIISGQLFVKFRTSDATAKAGFKKAGIELKTETITLNNNHLHYVQTGSDSMPSLVFIHGSPGSWDGFEDYLKDKVLGAKYRMIAIDRPGFGYSDYGNVMQMKKQVDLIDALLQRLQNNKPMYLVGHSLGGPMIVWLAGENPGMYNGLVILAGSVDPAEEKPETWRKIFNNPVLGWLLPGAFRQSNSELLNFKKGVYDLQPMFAGVKCKVVIVHGAKDSFVPPGNATFAKNKLIHALSVKTIMIPGASHFIPWQHYAEIKKVLLNL